MIENEVEKLRQISQELASMPGAEQKTILFPGWDSNYPEEPEPLIKKAARAVLAQKVARVILAEGLSPDEGEKVSLKEIAALIHYIADMLEP